VLIIGTGYYDFKNGDCPVSVVVVEIHSTLNFVHSTPNSLESPPSLPSKNPFSINRLPDAARQMLSDGRLRNPHEASPPKVALLSETSTMWSKKHKKEG